MSLTQAFAIKKSRPWAFSILILPLGVVPGYIAVTLSYRMSEAGISIEDITKILAVSFLPQVLKFLWAPLVDTTFSFKKWYFFSVVLSSIFIFSSVFIPIVEQNLKFLTFIIVALSFTISFVGMCVTNLIAYGIPSKSHGKLSGYMEAGNLVGASLGGGLGLWLSHTVKYIWISGGVLALICILSSQSLWLLKDHRSTIREKDLARTLKSILTDVYSTFNSRNGILSLLLCLMPIGTGASSNLWPMIAKDWHTKVETVAIVTGVLGGVISSISCFVGGKICDIIDRKLAYVVFGFLQACCAMLFAFSPHTPVMYVIGVCLYSATIGLVCTALCGLIFEVIGKGAAATKYKILGSLGNFPVFYMTMILGWGYARYGGRDALLIESGISICFAVIFFIVSSYFKKEKLIIR